MDGNSSPDDSAHIKQQFRQHFKTGMFEETFRVVKKSGEIGWLHARAYPVHNTQNQLYRSTGFVEDITIQIASVQDKLIYAKKLDKSFSEMLAAFLSHWNKEIPIPWGIKKT